MTKHKIPHAYFVEIASENARKIKIGPNYLALMNWTKTKPSI